MCSPTRSRGMLWASHGVSRPDFGNTRNDELRVFNHQAGNLPAKHGHFPIKHGHFEINGGRQAQVPPSQTPALPNQTRALSHQARALPNQTRALHNQTRACFNQATSRPEPAAPGSLEEFVIERYCTELRWREGRKKPQKILKPPEPVPSSRNLNP